MVTNVREWRLYHQFAQADLAGKLLFNLDLVGWTTTDDFESLFDQLWLVSKEAFEGSDGPKAWRGGGDDQLRLLAEVAGDANLLVAPREWPEPVPQDKPVYKVPLKDVKWLLSANKIDAQMRSSLEAFAGRDVNGNWAWLVQTTRRLSAHDFLVLTGQ